MKSPNDYHTSNYQEQKRMVEFLRDVLNEAQMYSPDLYVKVSGIEYPIGLVSAEFNIARGRPEIHFYCASHKCTFDSDIGIYSVSEYDDCERLWRRYNTLSCACGAQREFYE